jgi:hypothetical protein
MDHSTQGFLIGISLIFLFFFAITMTLNFISIWARNKLNKILEEKNPGACKPICVNAHYVTGSF